MIVHMGTYDVPEWALTYLELGYEGDLEDEEVEIAKAWADEHFPRGYYMEVNWDDCNEFNAFPAFGPRNSHALERHGESPYLACKTYKVDFYSDN